MLAEFGRFWHFVTQVFGQTFFTRRLGSSTAARHRIWVQMYDIGLKSVPVVMITGAFVGMTLAVQSYSQFKGIGLEDRLGSVINLSVIKELGPVLAAVMLAGRVGGALTAELGTMHVTEQIDALRAMGVDPIKQLVVPRFLACMLLAPFLIVYTDVMGILGGYLVSIGPLGINSEAYWRYSAQGVERWDIFVGLAKGIFFGACIALVACFKGFYCGRGAQGVGRACTEAFVYSFIAILVLNFLLAILAQGIYDTFWQLQSVF
jgi:phospholipid/cholesterol/gamma-HCH transport system permease protein